ncbi:DUF2059 domain-containing protein [Gramella sp. GC03-9]|uniref:DUF2059 domain-containing protein n=1 Tax=Christiangramia oceanisediminis TaxID=2920386 RepID=A0A9X2IBG8_9FLAO|nr:DUF2059 domain-containing protein [Gramella oceanisediminis]MCP9199848.1 DUF2059 domain-containing protein [Gramella oceanisediminis]
MKRTLFFLFIAVISFGAQAQETSTKEAKAIKLIEMTSGQQFDIMTEPLVNMVPEANQEAFKKELKASTGELYKKLATVYTDNFSEEELDQILAFYDTPVGEKMVETTPELTKKAMEIGQAWGQELQPLIMKYTN